jgi:hypothetical protein
MPGVREFVFSHLLANTFCGGEEGQLPVTPSLLSFNSTYLRSLREDTLSHKETKAPSELAAIHLGALREDVDVKTDLGINSLLCQDIGNQVVGCNAIRAHDSSLKGHTVSALMFHQEGRLSSPNRAPRRTRFATPA